MWKMGESTKYSATIVDLTKVRRNYALYLESSAKPNCSPGEKIILTPANARLSFTKQIRDPYLPQDHTPVPKENVAKCKI
jgi:hypothetical protein